MLGVYISIPLAYIYIMGRAHSKNREIIMEYTQIDWDRKTDYTDA